MVFTIYNKLLDQLRGGGGEGNKTSQTELRFI